MSDDNRSLSLSEAANQFLLTLPADDRAANQQEISAFVRWFGSQHALSGLTGPEVEHFAERLSLSDADYAGKLERIRAFLAYAKKEGWTRTNLATHLKPKKEKTKRGPLKKQAPSETVLLTREGYASLEVELEGLKNRRFELIEEIRRAAADKDFRENVPLHAAREQRSHVEGRIQELEKTLQSAAIIEEQEKVALRVNVGDTVILNNADSGAEFRCTLVSPREVDAAKGKISSVSPIGRAVVGRARGEVVEVSAPAGKLRYQIKHIER